MLKYRLKVRSVQNVGAGNTALIDLPCGQRYHYVELIHGYSAGTNTIAAAATNIKEIRVYSNSRVQRIMSGTQLRDMNLLQGTQYDCNGLPNAVAGVPGVTFGIYLGEPWRETPADQDALGWATAGWVTFQIQVDLGAAATPTLEAWAIVDDFIPPANSNPAIVKWIRSALVPAGTQFDFVTLDRRDWLQQISLYPDSGASAEITQVVFKRNSVLLHELTDYANIGLLRNHNMQPQATGRTSGIYDLVFDHDGLLSSAIPMDGARDSLITISAAAAMSGTMTAIIQRLGPPE